jgi:hypothetical protein
MESLLKTYDECHDQRLDFRAKTEENQKKFMARERKNIEMK